MQGSRVGIRAKIKKTVDSKPGTWSTVANSSPDSQNRKENLIQKCGLVKQVLQRRYMISCHIHPKVNTKVSYSKRKLTNPSPKISSRCCYPVETWPFPFCRYRVKLLQNQCMCYLCLEGVVSSKVCLAVVMKDSLDSSPEQDTFQCWGNSCTCIVCKALWDAKPSVIVRCSLDF